MFNILKSRMARRVHYRRIVAEIRAMDQRELLDIGATRDEMLRGAFDELHLR